MNWKKMSLFIRKRVGNGSYNHLKLIHRMKSIKKVENSDGKMISWMEQNFHASSYYFENGRRKVYPFYLTLTSYPKRRWFGKSIKRIIETDFVFPDSQLDEVLAAGRFKINDKPVESDYIVRRTDTLTHTSHKHEPCVLADPVTVIEDNTDMLVVNKPASMPVHPCGRYMFNSLTFILAKDNGYTLHKLKPLYRLDTFTSGVVILCKSSRVSGRMQKALARCNVHKEYVCRVQGNFPDGIVKCHQPIKVVTHKPGVFGVNSDGKKATTVFEKMFSDQDTSVVRCFPIVNDFMYNSDAWGPNKGKGGLYDLSSEELSSRILNESQKLKRRRPLCPIPEESIQYDLLHPGACECNKLHLNKHQEYLNNYMSSNNTCSEEEYFSHHGTPHFDMMRYHTQTTKSLERGLVNNNYDSIRRVHGNSEKKLSKNVSSSCRATNDERIYNPLKDTVDSYCWDCSYNVFEAKDMFMCLHAFRYKTDEWDFEAPLPVWAERGWR